MADDTVIDPNQKFLLKMIFNILKNYDLKSQAYSEFFDYMSMNSNFNFQFGSDWSIFYKDKKEKCVKKLMGIKKSTKNTKSAFDSLVSGNTVLLEAFLKTKDIDFYLKELSENSPYLNKSFELSSNVKILGKLLELNQDEMIFLQGVHAAKEYFSYYENTYYNIFTMKQSAVDIWALLLGLDKKVMKNILDNSILTRFNYVMPRKEYDSDGDEHVFRKMFSLTPILSDILNVNDLKENGIEELLFPGDLKTELTVDNYHKKEEIELIGDIVNATHKNKLVGTNIMFYGLAGSGKTELALAMAKKNNWNIKSVGDIDTKNDREKGREERIINLKLATKIYAKSKDKIVLLFDEMEDLFKFDLHAESSKAYLNRIIETTPVPIIWTCNNLEIMDSSVLRRMTMSLKFDVPPTSARKSIWVHENKRQKLGLDDRTINKLSEVYDVVPSVIKTATTIAKTSKLDHSKIGNIIEMQATLVNYGFKRIFNHNAAIEQMELYDLGFVNADHDIIAMTEKLKKCKPNFSLCLYGPPGTGKSAYGKYLASQLSKPVLFKKASDLLGKYVGESEANIARAFLQASDDDKVLIFDEADSLLGSREAANHSWEVSAVNQLLAEMENHKKPFVITTNLMKNLDSATMRRITFKIKFDYLTSKQISDIYFRYFNLPAPKAVLESYLLTPGDLAVVKKKADIMNITDNNEIAKMLLSETEAKPDFRKKMGF